MLEYFNDLKAAADSAKPAADKTPPTAPGSLQASVDVKEKTINLTWQPAQDNVGVVSYRIYRNGVNIDSVKIPHWKDTAAQPGTKYDYYLFAVDAAGNVSPASNHVSAEIPVEQSQEKPRVPAGLSVSATTQTTLDISWQPVTNVAISQYTVYRDGLKVQSSPLLSFHDSGLSANTTYIYSVVAQSVAGDLSELSAPLRAVTLADPATLLPAIAAWETDIAYESGDVVTYHGKKYQCLQRHTSIQDWNPEDALSLWKVVK
ncbi:fibronectin type III domain-containing protein [Erwinia sp. V71]|uniref:fibronectin type III domain-containing protein n=1 Tax=Erwinia sp. V71 TaxID=3369424 RepID=UPI003F61FAB9